MKTRNIWFSIFFLTLFTNVSFGMLPDTLRLGIEDLNGDGVADTLVLYKRSVRGPNFRVRTWDVTNGLVTVATPEVRTYRGYVKEDFDLRANATILPDGKLYAWINDGREPIYSVNGAVVTDPLTQNGTDPGVALPIVPYAEDRVSPSPLGSVVPKFEMRKLMMGCEVENDYYVELNGSIESCVARVESRVNDAEFHYARDIGIAWEIQEIVIIISDFDALNVLGQYWQNSNPDSPFIKHRVRFKAIGGGAAPGRIWKPALPDELTTRARVGTTEPGGRGIGHEIGHTLGCGHGYDVKGIMSGGRSLGTVTASNTIGASNLAIASNAPKVIYGDPIAPHARWDYYSTDVNQSITRNLIENDYDGNGDDITLEYVDVVSVEGGTVEDLGNGNIKYTPPANYVGIDYFNYHCEDETGISNRQGRVKVLVNNGDLLSYYPMDDSTGLAIKDIGVFNQPLKTKVYFENRVVPGIKGTAIHTSTYGSGDRAEFTIVDDVKGTNKCAGGSMRGDMSVSLWVKLSVLGSKTTTLLSKRAGGGWGIRINKNGRIQFDGTTHSYNQMDETIGGQFHVFTAKNFVVTDTWYHLVTVMDRTTHQFRAYVNGVEVTGNLAAASLKDDVLDSDRSMKVMPSNANNIEPGNYEYAMDELRIYGKALSVQEIEDLFNLVDDPQPAGAPCPKNMSTTAYPNQRLDWVPDEKDRFTYNVYFGEDSLAVANATTSSPEFMGEVTEEQYFTNAAPMTQYFWRIDEVDASANLVVPGYVWDFYTGADYVVENLKNPSFEYKVVKPVDSRNGVPFWYHHHQGYQTRTAWEGADVHPTTPNGDNWARILQKSFIYQQIGVWAPNKDYEIGALIGRILGRGWAGFRIELWAGSDKDNPSQDLGLGFINATLIDSSDWIIPNIAELETITISDLLSTGNHPNLKLGDPLWLQIKTKNSSNNAILVDSMAIMLADAPLVYFDGNTTNVCLGDTVTFTNNTLNHPESFMWDFGDGSTSTHESPYHVYSQPGTYTVTLSATNAYGTNVETKVDYIQVNDVPVVNLGADITLLPGESASLDAGSGLDSYEWSTNEMVQSIDVDMTTNFPQDSTYWVTVVDQNGCSSSDTITIIKNNETTSTIQDTVCDSYTSPSGYYTFITSGTYSDTIPNTLGADSVITINLIVNNSTTGIDVQTACDSYTWMDGNVYTASNTTATHVLTTATGCDSVVTLNLTINSVNVTTTVLDQTITSSVTGASYSWLDCDDYSVIAGATNQSYTAIENGSYAVEITQNNCVDTSDCQVISTIGVESESLIELSIHPNPSTDGKFKILFDGNIDSIEGFDGAGRAIAVEFDSMDKIIDLSHLAKGQYTIHITTEAGVIVKELVFNK